VFETSEKLKAHKLTHENHYEEYLPVLTVPDPSKSGSNNGVGGGDEPPAKSSRRRKSGQPRRSSRSRSAGEAMKRQKEERLGFAKFKIARNSEHPDSWQAVKAEEEEEGRGEGAMEEEGEKEEEKPMPILERILKERGVNSEMKAEEEEEEDDTAENDSTKVW
jgi:hypothetical protein